MKSKIFTRFRVYGFFVLLMLSSCKKNKPYSNIPSLPEAKMEYFDFKDREIKAGTLGFSIDINHDGRKDIAFSTLLVGDPINQVDKLQFLVQSNIKVNLPVNIGEEIPVMKVGDLIPIGDFSGYNWFELTSIILVQKVISFTNPPIWEGHWKNAVNRYIPFQIIESDKIYNGWIQISVDIVNEKLIIHRGAISQESNKTVKAGI
ncbi:MAG: hypothetical protein JSU05_08380 [Bacteroidetes bacterium]|nr:hypothetical protein [Bacteroidota bacterium]